MVALLKSKLILKWLLSAWITVEQAFVLTTGSVSAFGMFQQRWKSGRGGEARAFTASWTLAKKTLFILTKFR
jgi:hypothetical protein